MSELQGNYNYPTPYRIGLGRSRELGSACQELGIKRPLLVSDPTISNLPWFREIEAQLSNELDETKVFAGVSSNPCEKDVEAGVEAYRQGGHDGCVALGGGAALDVAKTIALMVGQSGSVFDYEDVGDNWTKVDAAGVAPVIALPTTAGTGSEVGRASVILDSSDHLKKIIFHPTMLPRLVIADPQLSFGLPAPVTAATGMDALAHCFEALCAPGYHPMADGIALEGIRLIHENLPRCFQDGQDAEARTHMMMAASMGATAFQKGLGLVHAIAHPLGGATGVHHGLSNAILMPYVMNFNRAEIEGAMGHLARYLGLTGEGFEAVMSWMLELRRALQIPHSLGELDNMPESLAAHLAPLALKDPSMGGNPRQGDPQEIEEVILRAIRGELEPR